MEIYDRSHKVPYLIKRLNLYLQSRNLYSNREGFNKYLLLTCDYQSKQSETPVEDFYIFIF